MSKWSHIYFQNIFHTEFELFILTSDIIVDRRLVAFGCSASCQLCFHTSYLPAWPQWQHRWINFYSIRQNVNNNLKFSLKNQTSKTFFILFFSLSIHTLTLPLVYPYLCCTRVYTCLTTGCRAWGWLPRLVNWESQPWGPIKNDVKQQHDNF